MPSTLEEIAGLSGVSRSTVSRVVNDHPRVSPTTRERVWDVIRREGYWPNLAARSLVSGKTSVLAVAVPVGFDNVLADPYYAVLLRGIASAADAQDRFVMLSLAEPGFRHRVDEVAARGVVDGVIMSAAQLDDPLIGPLLESGKPFVSVGRCSDDRVSYVDFDNRGSAHQVTSHLLRLGHRRVATIAGPSYAMAGVDRLQGYRDALEAFGLPYREELVFEGDFSTGCGRLGMRQLLEHQPDAVFAASDRMAAGARSELRDSDLRVPEDVALAGFDDLPLARRMEPALTTVRQSSRSLGEEAVALLLELIEHPESSPKRVVLPTELVVRASCGSNLNQETKERKE